LGGKDLAESRGKLGADRAGGLGKAITLCSEGKHRKSGEEKHPDRIKKAFPGGTQKTKAQNKIPKATKRTQRGAQKTPSNTKFTPPLKPPNRIKNSRTDSVRKKKKRREGNKSKNQVLSLRYVEVRKSIGQQKK